MSGFGRTCISGDSTVRRSPEAASHPAISTASLLKQAHKWRVDELDVWMSGASELTVML